METIESPTYRQFVTQRESAPNVLDVTDVPIRRKDSNSDDNGFRPGQRYIEHAPDGFDTNIATALVDEEATFSGNLEPRYSEVLLDLPIICGVEGFVSSTVLGDGRPKHVYQLPHTPRTLQEVSAWWGYGNNVVLLRQGAIRAWSIETSKGGETGGSREWHFLNFLRSQTLPNQVAQNAILQILGSNVTTDGVFSIEVDGELPVTLTVEIGDTESDIEAKLLALGITANVSGSVATATGEVHSLTATNATANAVIYGDVTVTPQSIASAIQTLVRAKGGQYANAVVTSDVTIGAGADILTAAMILGTSGGTDLGHGTYPDTVDDNPDSYIEWGNAGTGYVDFDLGSTTALHGWSLRTGPINGGTYRIYGSAAPFSGGAGGGGTQIGSDLTLSSNVKQSVTFGAVQNYRYIRVLGVGSASGPMISELELFPAVANGQIQIAFPFGAGDLPNITPTPGAGWTSQTVAAGEAGGTVNITITEPENTPATIDFVSGAGWSSSLSQPGRDGNGPAELFGSNVEPTHWVVYKAATKAELDAIDMGTRTVPASVDDENIVKTSTGHGISLENLVGVTKTENRSVHSYRHVALAPQVTATLTLLVQQNADGEDFAESIYATENKGGCSTIPFWLRFAARCGERELWIDLYCARSQSADPTTEEGVAMWQFPLSRIYRREGSLFFTLIEPAP